MATEAKPIAVIDCETDPFEYGVIPEPFIWGYKNATEYREFYDTEELVLFLMGRDETVYAHNGGKFDFQFLAEYINDFEELLIMAGRLVKCRMGDCELRDSFSILPVALGQMDKMEFDYNKLKKDVREKHMPEIREYLKSDCDNLFKWVSDFVSEYGKQVTLASAAMKRWEKIDGKKAPKSNAEFYQHFHKYYYGGRVECFKKGIVNHKFRVYDINSAYPRAMLEEHPYGLDYHENNEERKRRDVVFIGNHFYSLIGRSNGALPFRGEDMSLTFPCDNETRQYHATGWEIIAGLDTGTLEIDTVTAECFFYETRSFKDYVWHFWNMKLAAEKGTADYLFAKLMLNSLYGKFASNPDKYKSHKILPVEFAACALDDGAEFAGEIGEDKILVAEELETKRFYNVAVSASITGWVRGYLWKSICSCETPLYCDTDSIAFAGSHNLQIGDDLGQWDFEGEFKRGAIAGKKLYAFEPVKGDKIKTASKGVKLSASEIFRVANGEEILYQNQAPTMALGKAPRFIQRRITVT